MLINGSPVNATPTNGLNGLTKTPVSQMVVPGSAFRWSLVVLVSGSDVSSRLTGQIEVDRERGAAGLATFTMQMAAGAVIPMDWVGREVEIHYVSSARGATTQKRRYTGRIVTTEWNAVMRLLTCHCGDQLQQRVEKMSVEEVDALTPSFWSPDVFETPVGRSRWDYVQERLGTIQASLDSSADGQLRLTTWYAGGQDYVFGAGTTIYDSINVSYADLTSLTNKIEIDSNYRFSRLHQLNETFSWGHPDTEGFGGTQGFCLWRKDGSELPDIPMMKDSASSGGLSIIKTPIYSRVPASGGNICGNGQPWINSYADLLLGFSFVGARRWAQAVTEKYTLTVQADASIAQAGEVITRESLSIEYTTEVSEAWEGTAFGIDALAASTPSTVVMPVINEGESGHLDERDEPNRQLALRCVLNQAKTAIVLAHSATTISWNVPTSMVLDVDLVHTLQITDQGVNARARCSRVLDSFDLAAGTAITTLGITVMRGGGYVSDALNPPAPSVVPQPEDKITSALHTQLGGKPSSGVYSDTLDGFSGNYDNAGTSLEVFPRRLQIVTAEIPEEDRDEKVVELSAVYRVSIPNDLLEF